jgi:hypothetical protein
MPCNLETSLANSCTSGIGKLTEPVKLLQVIAQLLCDGAGGGGGGGGSQIKIYVADPNAEGIVPDDQALPAIAYSLNAALSNYNWNTSTLQWQ